MDGHGCCGIFPAGLQGAELGPAVAESKSCVSYLEVQRNQAASFRCDLQGTMLIAASGEFVSDHEAERRVLQLINPALSRPQDFKADNQKHHIQQTHYTRVSNSFNQAKQPARIVTSLSLCAS